MTIPSFKIKHKQYLLAGVVGAIGLIIIGAVLWSADPTPEVATDELPVKESQITTAGQRINPQEMWVDRMESDSKLTREKLEALEKLLMSNIKLTSDKDPQATELEQSQEDEGIEDGPSNSLPTQELPAPDVLPQMSGIGAGQKPSPGSVVRKIVLNLSKTDGKGPAERSTIENTIPAGAFAKAVLLGGVDASTSVQSQSDPRPVLLRVVDHGNLPRKFQSDLKACHILASSYGDLSSERVYMRLEKLTCTERLTGEISETQVAGYVVGEDGRAGIRGVVADRAGPVLRDSLVGGFLSGVGQFFSVQQQKTDFPTSPFAAAPALAPGQMLTAGAASGVSKALDKYADFYIKRLEQLQPVLQVAAGRQVDIVFTEGTQFGDTSVRQTISKIRNQSRQKTIQSLEESQDNSDWLPSVNKQGE
jgi:conjugal transfer pilus assembly protein TraB